MDIKTHNGTITAESCTGEHRTFRIKTQAKDAKFAPGQRILSLLIGQDNVSDFKSFAFVRDDRICVWKKFRGTKFETLAKVVQDQDYFVQKFGFVYHSEGACRVCNRKLTTPDSVSSGIGPICATR